MMMSKADLCCGLCFELIARQSLKAAKLWVELCNIRRRSYLFGLMIQDTENLQLLEQMRFITTTETDEMIIVKMPPALEDEAGAYFCRGDCEEYD